MLPAFLRLLRPKATRRVPREASFIPCFIGLEDRSLLSTFTVFNLNDQGAGSLREAILSANQNPGPDAIERHGP